MGVGGGELGATASRRAGFIRLRPSPQAPVPPSHSSSGVTPRHTPATRSPACDVCSQGPAGNCVPAVELQPQQVYAWVVRRVSPGRGAKRALVEEPYPLLSHPSGDPHELRPGVLRRDGLPDEGDRCGIRCMEATSGEQALPVELHVPASTSPGPAGDGVDAVLVGSLVGGESNVAVGAADLGVPELVRQLGEQCLEWTPHRLVVRSTVSVEPLPVVVGLQAAEPVQRLLGPSGKPPVGACVFSHAASSVA